MQCSTRLAGFFNWSLSYRLDSHFPKPYGKFIEVQFNREFHLFLIDKTEQKSAPPSSRDLDDYIKQFGEKNLHLSRKTQTKGAGLAAWFVSNCHSKSGREALVKKLKKSVQEL